MARQATLGMPGDKSITHRALMLSAIAAGQTRIVHPNVGEDVLATAEALRQCGVRIDIARENFIVHGAAKLRSPEKTIDCGNSGTTMRLLAGLLAGRAAAVLDGDASLRRRPMDRVAQPLAKFGIDVRTSAGGKPPIRIMPARSPTGARLELKFPSAQVKSAIIFTALGASGPSTIRVLAQTRDHTERMLRLFGGKISSRGRTIVVKPSLLVSPRRVDVPGDFSAAIFFIAAAAALRGARILLRGVGVNPTRTAALGVLRSMGARVTMRNRRTLSGEPVADLIVAGGGSLRGVCVDERIVPNAIDDIPALCALAAFAQRDFVVRRARELRRKESDRIATIVALLRRFGADARALPDGILVRGGRVLHAPKAVSTFGDHRIGMAAAVLAAGTKAPLRIEDAGCIDTSFPGFEAAWSAAFGSFRS